MTDETTPDKSVEISDEARRMIKRWCRMQEKKYGPDWKRLLAEELTDEVMPRLMEALTKAKAREIARARSLS